MIHGLIESVKLDDKHENVIVVRGANGAELRYLMRDGVLHPGRVWLSTSPDGYTVTFFLPFPDGAPVVLKVSKDAR